MQGEPDGASRRTPIKETAETQRAGYGAAGALWMRMPLIFYLCSLVAAVGAALMLHGLHPQTIGDLSNLMGPLAESVAHGRGYMVCTDAMTVQGNVLCSHASRMPLPPLLLAALVRIFHGNSLAIELVKIGLVLLPVAAAVALVQKNSGKASTPAVGMIVAAMLFLSLILPTQLIDVVNMQVEEGYSFCLLTYAVAVLLFGVRDKTIGWRTAILFALSVAALYLTKSSMVAAAAFLVFIFCYQIRDGRKRLAVVLLAACGPVGWGLYTWHASGRFSIGTSLDGMNLHKGNYAEFLERYPPADGGSLDRYDQGLNQGKFFRNEWKFNAYHMHAAESYMVSHPVATLHAACVKAWIFFFSLRKIGSEQYSGVMGRITEIDMVLFRLLLWGACGVALWLLVRGQAPERWAAVIYLGTAATVAAPYLAGFALTRHAGVLTLPSALFLGWWMIAFRQHSEQLG